MQPTIMLSVGEPSGIGPDLAVMLAQRTWQAKLIAVGDPDLLLARAKLLAMPLTLSETPKAGCLTILPVKLKLPAEPSQLNPANAQYVLECIKTAATYCLQHKADAMVTGPVHKGIINQAGIPFSGHTEYLAELTHAPHVVMLLSGQSLQVALLTTHLPLNQVANAITPALLEKTLRILHRDMQLRFAMTNPKIAVCGLNPHAGENGHMGREEIDIILPIIQALRREGMSLSDPLPADTVFHPSIRSQYDVILAMYHDQGLAPFKALEFGEGVNVTLGLPIIRTSVDHGTALHLAGTGKAEVKSLIAATRLAIQLATKERS